ncbi:MAG: tRNA (adenosine(37)-N6)-threonylcarbamoyltransferase complex ATPase subunit type 1 TsaE [Myxococcota bacterium]
MVIFNTQSPHQTHTLGAALGRVAQAGWVVALQGDLGAGKTCFAQGVGAGLQVSSDVVSPTFVLVAEHDGGRLPLLHADLYRLEQETELEGIGLEETLEAWPGVALVEWADRFPTILPLDHIQISLRIHEENKRSLEVQSVGAADEWVKRWAESIGSVHG